MRPNTVRMVVPVLVLVVASGVGLAIAARPSSEVTLESQASVGDAPSLGPDDASLPAGKRAALLAAQGQAELPLGNAAVPRWSNFEDSGPATAYDDPTYAGYTQSRFSVDRWIGIEISGDTARVLLEAHQNYLRNPDPLGVVPSGWLTDPVRRWQVDLVLTSAGWKIGNQSQLDLGQSE